MSAEQPVSSLRRALLAASVIDDIDLLPTDDGVVLVGPCPAELSWRDVADAIGEHRHDSATARARLTTALRLHLRVASQPRHAEAELRCAARVLALHPEHALHPGPAWVRDRVLGGALDCGIGLIPGGPDPAGTPGRPDEAVGSIHLGLMQAGADAVPLPRSVAEAAGIDVDALYADILGHAQAMGELAVTRLRRDTAGARRTADRAVLRPVGGLDVPSLLATAEVRAFLAASDGSGMRAIAVPIRSRGWYDLARIDPAFVQAAWAASSEVDRGLPRSLLVTADEVVQGPAGRQVIDLALADASSLRATT